MHIKFGLVAGLAVASTSAFTLQNSQSAQGLTQANEYAIRNMDQICISTTPVQMCQEGYVVKSFKNQKVNFHCLSRNSAEGQRLREQVENDQEISEMYGKTVHIQGRVQVPTKCVEKSQVSNQEQKRRQQQQEHGQRVELIEEDQQQNNSGSHWESEQDQLTDEEQYNQYKKQRYQEEKEWQQMQSIFNEYPQLTKAKLQQLVETSEEQYQETVEQLKQLIQQKQVTSHLKPQIQNTMPTYFSQVAKQLYDAVQEQQKQTQTVGQSQQDQQLNNLNQLVNNYQKYKQLMKRVYVYIVKETLKLNQQSPRLANVPELVRKVWENTARQGLTKKQVQLVEDMTEQIQDSLKSDQTNDLVADELVSEKLKTSQKQARRNLMKIIVSGLIMMNENNSSY